MYKIACLVPDESMVDVAQSAFQEHVAENPAYRDDSFSVYVAHNYRDIPRQVLEADVVISRGVISDELKRIYRSIPMVEITIGAEMTAAVLQAVQEHGSHPIAVIGAFNMAYAAYGVKDFVDVDIKSYEQTSREEFAIARYLDTAIAEGRRLIICGPVTYRMALDKECWPYVLGMAKSSVREAISRARAEIATRKNERVKAAQLQALLSSAHEGLLITDKTGKIDAFNAASANLLGISPAEALNASIREVLPRSAFTDSFRRAENSEAVIKCRDRVLAVRKTGIILGGELLGHVVAIQPYRDGDRTLNSTV